MEEIKSIKKQPSIAEEIENEVLREKRGKLKEKLKEKYKALYAAEEVFNNLKKEYEMLKNEVLSELS